MFPQLRKAFIASTLLFALDNPLYAQDDYEPPGPLPTNEFSIGVTAGLSDLWGDIGTKQMKDHYTNGVYFQHPNYMAGIYLRYSATPWLAVRLGFNAGTLYATDEYNKKLANETATADRYGDVNYLLYARNQDVKTSITEGLLYAEIMPFRIFPNAGISHWRFQPLLVGGIGIFHFNPKTTYTAPDGSTRWVEIHDLHLEGEGLGYAGAPKGYKLTQMNVPIGGGFRFEMTPTVTFGLEYMVRLTFTDYLDGVSDKYADPAIYDRYLSPQNAAIARQVNNKSYLVDPEVRNAPGDIRGTPKHKDAYSTWSVSATIRIPKRKVKVY